MTLGKPRTHPTRAVPIYPRAASTLQDDSSLSHQPHEDCWLTARKMERSQFDKHFFQKQ